MIELTDMKTLQKRLREQTDKTKKLLAAYQKKVAAGPNAFESYAQDVIDYNERVRLLVEASKAARVKGNSVEQMFGFYLHCLVTKAESPYWQRPALRALSFIVQLFYKHSSWA